MFLARACVGQATRCARTVCYVGRFVYIQCGAVVAREHMLYEERTSVLSAILWRRVRRGTLFGRRDNIS
jgi:hypothetical protein